MPESFFLTFGTTFLSMMQIFFIVLIAGWTVRKKIISQENLSGLSTATVDVFLPCLIFTNTLSGLQPDEFSVWWVLPIIAVVMSFVGLAVAWLLFYRELPEKMNILPVAFIQNSGYLVLPLGAVLFADQFELFSVYVFLYILGQNPIMWSLGKYMATADPGVKIEWKGLITPPLVATILALIFIFTGLRDLMIPDSEQLNLPTRLTGSLLDGLNLLGEATVPLALFILGGMLGGITFKIKPYIWDSIRVIGIKLLLIPALTMAVLYFLNAGKNYPLMAVFLVIQSAAAPAVSIMLQIKRYGGDEQKVGSILLVSYIVCMVSLPVWVAVWELIQ